MYNNLGNINYENINGPIILYGGDGLLGRHLAILAIASCLDVVIVTRNANSSFFNSKLPHVNVISLEVFFSRVGEDIIRSASALVYLASSSVPGTKFSALEIEIEKNTNPLLKTLSFVFDLNPCLVGIYISSGGTVYGDSKYSPIREDAELAPISSYGLGKVLSEYCIKYLGVIYPNPIVILRVSNAIGLWQKNYNQGIVGTAIRSLLQKYPLTLYGDGVQIRDFIWADDVASAILFSISIRKSDVWNIGSGVGYSIKEIISMLENFSGKKFIIKNSHFRSIDVRKVVLDISKFQNQCNWRPRVSIDQAIKFALDHANLL